MANAVAKAEGSAEGGAVMAVPSPAFTRAGAERNQAQRAAAVARLRAAREGQQARREIERRLLAARRREALLGGFRFRFMAAKNPSFDATLAANDRYMEAQAARAAIEVSLANVALPDDAPATPQAAPQESPEQLLGGYGIEVDPASAGSPHLATIADEMRRLAATYPKLSASLPPLSRLVIREVSSGMAAMCESDDVGVVTMTLDPAYLAAPDRLTPGQAVASRGGLANFRKSLAVCMDHGRPELDLSRRFGVVLYRFVTVQGFDISSSVGRDWVSQNISLLAASQGHEFSECFGNYTSPLYAQNRHLPAPCERFLRILLGA